MKNALWTVLALFACTLAAPSASSREVSDEAKFFSADTVRKANQEITQFKEKYHKDIVVETFPVIPDNKKAQYQPEKKDEFFTAWLRERAQTLKVDGIYILITRDPPHLQVGVGTATAKMGFTHDDRNKVRDLLVDRFKRKDYDQGLLDAITLISKRFEELSRAHPAAAPARDGGSAGGGAAVSHNPGGLSWFAWLLIAIVGLLIVRFIARAFQRMSYGGPQPPYGQGGGGYGGGYGPPPASGGGFFTSMLGGLFGGAAGNWLANRWMGGGHEGEAGAGPHGPAGEEGRGFDSSGGDFGPGAEPPSSGGGDFGDTGSGDFGGGGGGGDSGGGAGGGGDF